MIVAFSHPKGGVGKTLLAFNYAIYSLYANKKESKGRVIVVDLDGQHSITNFNKLRQLKTSLPPLEILQFQDVNKLIGFLNNANDNDKIIIDTGGFDSSNNRLALALADKVITPVSDSPVELMRLYDFDKIIKEIASNINTNPIKAYIVLNRIHNSLRNIDYIKEPFKDKKDFIFLDSIVRDRARIKFSVANGVSVFEEDKNLRDEKAIGELLSLFNEIDNIKTKG